MNIVLCNEKYQPLAGGIHKTKLGLAGLAVWLCIYPEEANANGPTQQEVHFERNSRYQIITGRIHLLEHTSVSPVLPLTVWRNPGNPHGNHWKSFNSKHHVCEAIIRSDGFFGVQLATLVQVHAACAAWKKGGSAPSML